MASHNANSRPLGAELSRWSSGMGHNYGDRLFAVFWILKVGTTVPHLIRVQSMLSRVTSAGVWQISKSYEAEDALRSNAKLASATQWIFCNAFFFWSCNFITTEDKIPELIRYAENIAGYDWSSVRSSFFFRRIFMNCSVWIETSYLGGFPSFLPSIALDSKNTSNRISKLVESSHGQTVKNCSDQEMSV